MKRNSRKLILSLLISLIAVVPALKAEAYTITPLGTASSHSCFPVDYSIIYGWIGGCEIVGTETLAFATMDYPINIQTPLFSTSEFPDYASSKGVPISSYGTLAGYYTDTFAQNYAFYWEVPYDTKAHRLPSGGLVSEAYGINDYGTITGQIGGVAAKWDIPYSSWTSLGTLGGSSSTAYDINSYGEVVGQSETSSGANHAFFLAPGYSMYDIHPFPAAYASAAGAIGHSSGWTVGVAYYSSGRTDGFVWPLKGPATNLTTVCGSACNSTNAYNINSYYLVVGRLTTPSGNYRAFLYDSWNNVFTDLNTLLPPGSNWVLEVASGVDDNGNIIGIGRRSGGDLEGFLMMP